ncbi:DUF4288 domain-containing protein [Neobacillus sp. MER 74]|uniref:DUF4288 domain-containing protein n=1 Tax=Neobacillus sp. MER 74 TaxID=2939566 RepID=UPI0020401AA3|nr:DUF4288 domain-containing protein [Neobacillus sp. MER 74]MCM3116323.1 DUF4288 domain-containing protein [Neobacillus sp. MER 74]
MKKRLRKKMSKEWEWYAVKVLYECNISGIPSPEIIDENYSNTHKTFEESIILVKASSFEQAYVIAEKEAKKAEIDYLNPYEELVEWKFIEALDCFNLFDEKLQSGTELYSRFLRVPKDMSREIVISHYYPETLEEDEVDQNFNLRNKNFNARPNSN